MTTDPIDQQPLLSNRALRLATLLGVLLIVILVGISVSGRWIGERIALAGHTDSTELFSITIGQDQLTIPANTIRFQQARMSGPADRVDLYLTWPEMSGYNNSTRSLFSETDSPGRLIFLQINQSTMSRDMSGRVEPIYKGLFEGDPSVFGAGLQLHRLRSDSGYHDEVMLTGQHENGAVYAVRCIMPSSARNASNADCQRDILIGRDLSVLYRFSSSLLPQWQALDEAVRRYMIQRLAR